MANLTSWIQEWSLPSFPMRAERAAYAKIRKSNRSMYFFSIFYYHSLSVTKNKYSFWKKKPFPWELESIYKQWPHFFPQKYKDVFAVLVRLQPTTPNNAWYVSVKIVHIVAKCFMTKFSLPAVSHYSLYYYYCLS